MSKPNDFDFTGLSAPERLLLAQQLLDSVLAEATPLAPQQLAEMQRRAEAIDSNQIACEPWGSVRARLLPDA
jgi:putative addiction module component (TIGR02574 family)